MKTALVRLPGADQWADRICKQLGKTVESIIDVGRVLVKAKAALPHGEWGRLFDDHLVPFTRQTAFRLIAIAEHPQLSNVTHAQHLPATWTVLYELTRVEPKRLTAALKAGTITPDMKRKDVKALLPVRARRHRSLPLPMQAPGTSLNDAYRTASSALYFQVMTVLSDGLDVLSTDDRDGLLDMLRQSIEDLRAGRQEVRV